MKTHIFRLTVSLLLLLGFIISPTKARALSCFPIIPIIGTVESIAEPTETQTSYIARLKDINHPDLKNYGGNTWDQESQTWNIDSYFQIPLDYVRSSERFYLENDTQFEYDKKPFQREVRFNTIEVKSLEIGDIIFTGPPGDGGFGCDPSFTGVYDKNGNAKFAFIGNFYQVDFSGVKIFPKLGKPFMGGSSLKEREVVFTLNEDIFTLKPGETEKTNDLPRIQAITLLSASKSLPGESIIAGSNSEQIKYMIIFNDEGIDTTNNQPLQTSLYEKVWAFLRQLFIR